MRKIIFITFGGPKTLFEKAVNRICNEAKIFAIFDEISAVDDNDLKKDEIFWKQHGNFIENNSRGYGFWIWKPYIILKKLMEINENDILVYADCGCEINSKGKKRFLEYIDMLDNNLHSYGLISFQLNDCLEKTWTKKKIFEWFMVNEEIKNTNQFLATAQIIKKNNHSMNIINTWYYNMIYRLINDNTQNEHNDFIENRHDQSIYSIIVKKFGSIKINDEITDITDTTKPILAKRNRYS